MSGEGRQIGWMWLENCPTPLSFINNIIIVLVNGNNYLTNYCYIFGHKLLHINITLSTIIAISKVQGSSVS